jgi:hypothetical protein
MPKLEKFSSLEGAKIQEVIAKSELPDSALRAIQSKAQTLLTLEKYNGLKALDLSDINTVNDNF